jgi:hypothetical protein
MEGKKEGIEGKKEGKWCSTFYKGGAVVVFLETTVL